LLLLLAGTASAAELSPQQSRGKQLYLTGESGGGRPFTALIGADDVEVPASVVPCASCHGRDGRGRAEGRIAPANVQWDVLAHALTSTERSREPYTRSLLKRAVTMGLDSSSKPLQNTMPRYRMALEEMEDLLSYLELLGTDHPPGVSDDAVRLGAVLPAAKEEQEAVRRTLTAYFATVEVFGRRVHPLFTVSSGTAAERAASLEAFVTGEDPFAIAAAWMSGADAEMSAVADRLRVPAIAAFSNESPAQDRYVFRLLAGEREQRLALLAAAAPEPDARVVVIGDNGAVAEEIPADADVVLFVGAPSRLAAVLEQAAAMPSPPRILIPAAHSSGELTSAPAALDGRIFVALPSSPEDISEEGAAELAALDVPPAHATACRLALASARLLVEALRLGGRDLDRDALVSTLETFYRKPTSLTPPVTWAPNQHTGTASVHVVSLDLRAKRWVDRGMWTGERSK
jgi:ABC-type branched-subunit amino acid transport system substrate-binding protein